MGLLNEQSPQMTGLLGPSLLTHEQPTGLLGQMMFDPRVRQWHRGFAREFGEPPNVGPGDYNYGLAFGLGVRPEPYEHDPRMYHWPSRAPAQPPRAEGPMLKAPDHETAWMENFMQVYGVDPNEAPPELLLDAMQKGIMPSAMPAR